MGIALLTLSGLFKGLTSFKCNTTVDATATRLPLPAHTVWGQRKVTCSPSGLKNKLQTHAVRPNLPTPALRVLRVTESGQRVIGAGRMVISGRMADVCAELERLAALEAAQARI